MCRDWNRIQPYRKSNYRVLNIYKILLLIVTTAISLLFDNVRCLRVWTLLANAVPLFLNHCLVYCFWKCEKRRKICSFHNTLVPDFLYILFKKQISKQVVTKGCFDVQIWPSNCYYRRYLTFVQDVTFKLTVYLFRWSILNVSAIRTNWKMMLHWNSGGANSEVKKLAFVSYFVFGGNL